MTGDGNNLIDILGCLNNMKTVTKSVVWISSGPASLIVFLRSIGMNFTQIRDNLRKLECLPDLVYGGNIEPYTNTKMEIFAWMENILNSSRLFSIDTTLKDVYKMTKLYPTFITSEGILDPTCNVSLIDAVIASMCMLGVFDRHIIEDVTYTDALLHDVFPTNIESNVKIGDTLYITNYSKSLDTPSLSILDNVQQKLSQNYFERVLMRVKNNDNNILLINSVFTKETLNEYETTKRFENGKIHAEMFLRGESTLGYIDLMLHNIKNQS
jgi:hypothetical protein